MITYKPQRKPFGRTTNPGEWYVLSRVSSQGSLSVIFEKNKNNFSQRDRWKTMILLKAGEICWNEMWWLHLVWLISHQLLSLGLFSALGSFSKTSWSTPQALGWRKGSHAFCLSPWDYIPHWTWQLGLLVSPTQLISFHKRYIHTHPSSVPFLLPTRDPILFAFKVGLAMIQGLKLLEDCWL